MLNWQHRFDGLHALEASPADIKATRALRERSGNDKMQARRIKRFAQRNRRSCHIRPAKKKKESRLRVRWKKKRKKIEGTSVHESKRMLKNRTGLFVSIFSSSSPFSSFQFEWKWIKYYEDRFFFFSFEEWEQNWTRELGINISQNWKWYSYTNFPFFKRACLKFLSIYILILL